jgi:hypothetical protein
MDKLSQNFEGEQQHPPQDQFLLYVDGELAAKETGRWESHLDACWSCRVRVAKIEETIAEIIEFEDTVSQFQILRPTHTWTNFDSRLHTLATDLAEPTFGSRFFDFWKLLGHFRTALWANKLVFSSLTALAILAIIYQFVLVAPVSASELLEKAAAEQQQTLSGTIQPVVYRKLKVSDRDRSALLEVWNDVGTARNKRAFTAADDSRLLSEYDAVMARNGLAASTPLSPEAFRAWHTSLADKADAVEQTTDNNLKLTTVINSPRAEGDITSASFVVRSADWHPVAQSIEFKAANETRTFDVSELEFKVVARETLAKNFFDESTATSKVLVTTTPGSSPSPDLSEPGSVATGLPTNTAEPPNAATADLEVEVMSLLNQAKADMGEQITVERENGVVHVRGIVETAERKREILAALQPVSGNQAVRIEINTLVEALAAEKNRKKGATSTQQLEAGSTASAAESDLIQHFGSIEAARTFASQMVARSSRAMSHAYALKRLTAQFKAEELKQMSSDARSKWLALIAQHARAFQSETEGLRNELQGVFGGGSAGAGATAAVNSITDLPRAVESLLSLAQANDRVLRSAMTVSADGPQFSALRTAQFWQSLRTAETLAAKIQNVK